MARVAYVVYNPDSGRATISVNSDTHRVDRVANLADLDAVMLSLGFSRRVFLRLTPQGCFYAVYARR